MAWQLFQPLQQLQRRLQFHAVVGRCRIMAAEFLDTAIFKAQQSAPTAWTRVAAAGSIGGSRHHPTPSFSHCSPCTGFGTTWFLAGQ